MADLAHAIEGDNDLIGDTDARHWAERFASRFRVVRVAPATGATDTEGLMLGWFACAIETGRDARPHVPEDLASAVFQALGEASMCWSETPAGVFDSTRAKAVGDALLEKIAGCQ